MVVFQVRKVVVVTMAEAVKTTLEHAGARRMQLTELGTNGGEEARKLVSLYGELRRIKDYLQRCVGAYRDEVELDLADADLPLLTACCRRGAELLDQRLASQTPGNARDLLEERRDLLIQWAIALASSPLLELPLPRVTKTLSAAMSTLRLRLSEKVSRQAMVAGVHAYDRPLLGPVDGPLVLEDRPVEGQSPTERALSASSDATGGDDDEDPAWGSPRGGGVDLLSVRRVRNPQLRAIMTLDLRALDRAMRAGDHRMASVHLASVVEGAALDHALTRTEELGLTGSPGGWQPEEVLLASFGPGADHVDRAAASHLFASLRLVRPAAQLGSPVVVTAASFEEHLQFAQRALRQLGYKP